jgi:hypothetical protein
MTGDPKVTGSPQRNSAVLFFFAERKSPRKQLAFQQGQHLQARVFIILHTLLTLYLFQGAGVSSQDTIREASAIIKRKKQRGQFVVPPWDYQLRGPQLWLLQFGQT